jgi:homoserine kinase
MTAGKTSSSETPRATSLSFEVRLPASTSNLGSGFDCFGLALQLYLTIRATVVPKSSVKCRVRTTGTRESSLLPRTAENLIYRAMVHVAKHEGVELPRIDLVVQNQVPIGRGLGSSAAAIVGGIKLFGLLCNIDLPDSKILDYAAELEGHPDNVGPTLVGGFVVSCIRDQEVVLVKRPWPGEIKIIVVSPQTQLETKRARAALTPLVARADAVYNLQRSALFVAALAEGRYELLWEGMQDRLHQDERRSLVPGLAEALEVERMPGLLGVALSGAGPSVLALAQDNFEEIGLKIASCFDQHKIKSSVRVLEVDINGCQVLH